MTVQDPTRRDLDHLPLVRDSSPLGWRMAVAQEQRRNQPEPEPDKAEKSRIPTVLVGIGALALTGVLAWGAHNVFNQDDPASLVPANPTGETQPQHESGLVDYLKGDAGK